MLGKNYLSLVNDAIFEANVTLDPLTADNFENPPRTVMYERFKKWVNDAYVELLEDRSDWRFRVARATLLVYPRLFLQKVDGYPEVGHILKGSTSGIEFEIMDIHTHELTDSDEETRTTISIKYLNMPTPNTSFVFGEVVDDITPGQEWPDFAVLQGLGTYDFKSQLSYMSDIIPDSVFIHNIPGEEGHQAYDNITRGQKLVYIDNAMRDVPFAINYNTTPYAISKVATNFWQLHPQPGHEMILEFNYSKEINRMTLPYDLPFGLPDELHDYLVWRAVAEYADFQRDSAVWARAKKHLDKYDYYLFRDQVKQAKFVDCAFTGG